MLVVQEHARQPRDPAGAIGLRIRNLLHTDDGKSTDDSRLYERIRIFRDCVLDTVYSYVIDPMESNSGEVKKNAQSGTRWNLRGGVLHNIDRRVRVVPIRANTGQQETI